MTDENPRKRTLPYGSILVALLTAAVVAVTAVLGPSLGGAPAESTAPPAATRAPRQVIGETVILADNGRPAAGVMLLTLDGARADYVEPYIVDGTMQNLALLASNGLVTEYVLGVQPASPAVSHISLASGSRPRVTGVVGERYRRIGQPTNRVTEARSGVIPQAPALWQWDGSGENALDAVLFWPGLRIPADDGNDLLLVFDAPVGPAQAHALELHVTSDEVSDAPASFSPYRMGRSTVKGFAGESLAELWVVGLDTLDDDAPAYDALYIALTRPDAAAPEAFIPMKSDSWTVLGLPDMDGASLAFHLISLKSGYDGVHVTLYQSQMVRLSSSPELLSAELVAEVGPPAPAPDRRSLDDGLISEGDYISLAERHLRWKTNALAYIQERYSPRILAASLDIVRLLSDIQPAGGNAGVYDPTLRAAYRTADSAVGRLLAGLDLNQSTVLIGSPHGYAPAGIALNMGLVLDDIQSTESENALAAYSSGGSAHIVVNLAGREPGGTVSGAMYDTVVADTVAGLEAFTLEEQPAFERIASGAALRDLGLDSPNSGDIFVQAAAGVVLHEDDPTGEGRLWWFTDELAAGYDAGQPAMRGVFVAAGRAVPNLGMVAPIHLADLAPTIGEMLDIDAPAELEGRVLRELLQQ